MAFKELSKTSTFIKTIIALTCDDLKRILASKLGSNRYGYLNITERAPASLYKCAHLTRNRRLTVEIDQNSPSLVHSECGTLKMSS